MSMIRPTKNLNLPNNTTPTPSKDNAESSISNQIAFYADDGRTVSPSLLTTDTATTALNVPATLSAFQTVSSGGYFQDRNPQTEGAFAGWVQSTTNSTVTGSGWALGNAGGWTVNKNDDQTMNAAQRGITQLRSGTIWKHAVGDTAGIYHYVRSDGGISAASDEGVTAAAFQSLEPSTYFHGTVSSTSGTGDQAPVLTYTGVTQEGAHTTDGAFLLNISKGTLAGNLNGNSFPLQLDEGSGSFVTYLNALPVTGVTLPISTAVGIATAPIANPVVAANNPIPTNVTVTLCKIGGVAKSFTTGQVVTVAGINYPEQSVLTNVADHGDGTQTLTMKLRNPNTQAIIFQGGIQGQYISFDANLALSGMRSSYFAFGSLTGTDLIYGLQVGGGVANNILPLNAGSEAAQSTGPNSGFHLYPGAEVVANTDFGFACTLEQNGVVWGVNDLVENPHYPVYGGAGLFVNRFQQTPSHPGFGSTGFLLAMDGAGIGGGNTAGFRMINGYNPAGYAGSGGSPLMAPQGIVLEGAWNNSIYMNQAPDTGAIILVQNNNAAASDLTEVIGLDFAAGGNFTFRASTSRWAVDGSFDAQNGFFSNHVPGASGTFTTADGKTVTVSGGIIVGIA